MKELNYNNRYDTPEAMTEFQFLKMLRNNGVFKLPEMVYQTIWSIGYAPASTEDIQEAARKYLHWYIEENHPGYELAIFEDVMRDRAADIHPVMTWGLYYTVQKIGAKRIGTFQNEQLDIEGTIKQIPWK
jgi:hypothetical protein